MLILLKYLTYKEFKKNQILFWRNFLVAKLMYRNNWLYIGIHWNIAFSKLVTFNLYIRLIINLFQMLNSNWRKGIFNFKSQNMNVDVELANNIYWISF